MRADFDGDLKPDLVMGAAAERGYVVRILFSTPTPPTSLRFADGAPGMQILSRDVNQDNDADLILTSCTSVLPVAVFLGDGKGHFQQGNPWNDIPVGFDPTSHYDPTAGHEGPASSTEDKRFFVGALSGSLPTLRLKPEHGMPQAIESPVPEAEFSNRAPRAPPTPFCL